MLGNNKAVGNALIVARGKRLKKLRMIAGLSRDAIEEKYAISKHTLRAWEGGLHSGLTEDGAKRMISVFFIEGIQCSLDWLMYGSGEPPIETGLKPQEFDLNEMVLYAYKRGFQDGLGHHKMISGKIDVKIIDDFFKYKNCEI